MRRALVFMLLVGLSMPVVAADEAAPTEIPQFPNFTLTRLDGDGTIQLDDFDGRPVLLTFWASWCGPCRTELPELKKLYGELAGKGFVLLTVNVDTMPISASHFLKTLKLEIPVYRMAQRDLVMLGVNSLPTNVLLDPERRPVQIYRGYSPQVVDDIRRLVGEMLGTPAADDDASTDS